MSTVSHRRESRHWADVLAVLATVTLVGMSVRLDSGSTFAAARVGGGSVGTLVAVRIGAAVVAVVGIVLAQRGGPLALARALLGVAAIILMLVAVLLFPDLSPWEFWSLVAPAAALAVASTAIIAAP